MFMELSEVKHVDAKDSQKAVYWLKEYGDRARIIAGATDLLSLMKDRIEGPGLKTPEVLVNIKTIPGMNEIGYDKSGRLRIGAGVTLDRIETSQIIGEKFPILSQAASQVGTLQLRNMGTLGGNICQRPRCMYFRHPHFICRKKGGKMCFAITGEHRDYYAIINNGKCVTAHPSDMAPALVALNAKVVIAGSDGKRGIPLQELFLGPNEVNETILQPDEILTEFLVPKRKEKLYQFFLKQRIRRSFDFALTSVAAVAQIDQEVCTEIRMVLGGVAPFPYVALEAEQVLKGKKFSDELISMAADASVKEARPLPMNNYKKDLTRVSVIQVLKMIWQKSLTT